MPANRAELSVNLPTKIILVDARAEAYRLFTRLLHVLL
jgi:hypothetical protein